MSNKLITKEEADAAEELIANSTAWVDLDRGYEMCLDGWFTITDLEHIILLKRYKDQQGKVNNER